MIPDLKRRIETLEIKLAAMEKRLDRFASPTPIQINVNQEQGQGQEMADGNETNMSFGDNAEVENLQTGEHAVNDQSQGKVDNTGATIGGDQNNTNTWNSDETNLVIKVIDSLERDFYSAQDSAEKPPEPIAEPINLADATPDNPPLLFGAMRQLAAEESPDPESTQTLVSKFSEMVKAGGPKVCQAMVSGTIATLEATVKTHPLVAGVVAALQEFRK